MKKRVFLDGKHTAVISVNESKNTVFAELETENGTELIYAEKFVSDCNFEKEAIKACIRYLNDSLPTPAEKSHFVNLLTVFTVI